MILSSVATAANAAGSGPTVLGIPVGFVLFAVTLLGVAFFHKHTLAIAVAGLLVITAYRIGCTDFSVGEHYFGDLARGVSPSVVFEDGVRKGLERLGELPLLLNLLGLLVGFALLSARFAASRIPDLLPNVLPDGWKGGFVLLVLVFILSSFLDNIAAAMIGGTIANVVFKNRVHLGYLAAIVAASNAGGAGSVVGDTTTTMMWIDGVDWKAVLHAYVASGTALFLFGIVAAKQQDRHQRIAADAPPGVRIDGTSIFIVIVILASAIVAAWKLDLPAAGVWIAILLTAKLRRPAWHEVPVALKGSIFLLSLVCCASMMPVAALPSASWHTTLGLGFVSAVFDNIPLTKLALDQGSYDWGFLAYAVGFGGSMIWFGSSAGVAISNIFPEAKSAGAWLKSGWHVAVAYVIGFFVLLAIMGWHPTPIHR